MTKVRERQALVIGGASCIWNDVAALEELHGKPWDGLVVAANDVGAHWPRTLHHWATLHNVKMPRWKDLRAALGQPACQFTTWGQVPRYDGDPTFTDRVALPWSFGSSGMFAAQVAMIVGCSRVILCGIPMTDSAHFAESRESLGRESLGRGWPLAHACWRNWMRGAHLFAGSVRSMSGRTRAEFGAPTAEWLA